jgi:hypothetical protein
VFLPFGILFLFIEVFFLVIKSVLMSKQKKQKKRKEKRWFPECLGSDTRGRGFLIKIAEFLPCVPRRSTRGREF